MHVIILPDQRLGQYELEIALSPDRVGEHLIRLDTFNRLILADRLEISHFLHGRVDFCSVCVSTAKKYPSRRSGMATLRARSDGKY